jgi:hypothetical protein
MITDMLNINKETARDFLKNDLGKLKVCPRFVPHSVTPERKQKRIDCRRHFIKPVEDDPNILKRIVMGEDNWCFQYYLETKRQSMEWRQKNSPTEKKIRLQKSRVNTMLIVVFDIRGIMHKEFVPQGTTVNSHYYLGVMQRLYERMRRVRRDLFDTNSWLLLHDNAPSHCALNVKHFWRRKRSQLSSTLPTRPIWHQLTTFCIRESREP